MLDRLAIISDVHGNVTALQAVLADIQARGISRIVNLGDVIGKGPRGSEAFGWSVRLPGRPRHRGRRDAGRRRLRRHPHRLPQGQPRADAVQRRQHRQPPRRALRPLRDHRRRRQQPRPGAVLGELRAGYVRHSGRDLLPASWACPTPMPTPASCWTASTEARKPTERAGPSPPAGPRAIGHCPMAYSPVITR